MGIIPIISYSKGLEQLATFALKRELIPFFGAGFSYGCPACEGVVPNSIQTMASMRELILQFTSDLTEELLSSLDFYSLSDLFFQYVPLDIRAEYFEQNYTDVILYQNQKDFLNAIDRAIRIYFEC